MKSSSLFHPSFVGALFLTAASACSAPGAPTDTGDGDTGGDGDTSGTGNSPGVGDGDDGGIVIPVGTGGSSGDKPVAMIEATLPAGFTANTAMPTPGECSKLPGGVCFAPAGGFLRQGSVDTVMLEASNSCRNVLRGIVRDFDHAHADFGGDPDNADGVNTGIVQATLPETRKPLASGTSNQASAFADWFENGGGANVPYVVDFWLQPVGEMFIFDSSRFFPLEGVGTTSGNDNGGIPRNFGFTTELHTAFEYKGGEVFTFTGDDDVFVYINNQLAVDLGGVHSQFSQSVNIDTFAATAAMVIGQVYNLDLFHAERNPTGSNFRIETSLDFKECGVLETDIVVR